MIPQRLPPDISQRHGHSIHGWTVSDRRSVFDSDNNSDGSTLSAIRETFIAGASATTDDRLVSVASGSHQAHTGAARMVVRINRVDVAEYDMTLTPLTEYEAKVAAQIATWKAEKISLYTQLTSRLTRPIASVIQYAIPEVAARKAIEAAYATSDWLANPEEIIKKGGVSSLDELQHKSLELSDRLADQIGGGSMTIAAIDGAVTGAGGFLLAAADVGALAVLALRAIHRTGHCYGFPLDQPQDRSWVLGILLLVGTKSAVERLEVLGKLQNVQNWVMSETVEALAMERFSRELVELASLGEVPGIGAFVGTAANLVFIRQVLRAARHVFQERWLRGNCKIESISPAPS